jgi:hypothetical protein
MKRAVPQYLRNCDDEFDITKVYVWWSYEKKDIRVFEFGSREVRIFMDSPESRGWSSQGACMTSWRHLTDEMRILEVYEMIIEFCVVGIPPGKVLKEFMQVRQIADQGYQSNWMARALTYSLTGRIHDSLDRWLPENMRQD